MATIRKAIKLVNPGKKRKGPRKMTALQLKYFGKGHKPITKVARRKANTAKRKVYVIGSQTNPRPKRVVRAKKNIASIVVLGANPGKRKKGTSIIMATKTRRKARRSIKVSNPRRRARKANSRKVYVINSGVPKRRNRRARRANPYIRRRRVNYSRRRRNPGMGEFGTRVVGVLAGAAITSVAVRALPATFQSGFLKYIATGGVALGLGWAVGKYAGKPSFGADLAVGGLTILGLQILTDLVPSLASYTGLSLKGMGNLIGPSTFYTPQVPVGGSMTQFVLPSAIANTIPARANKAMGGFGRLAVVPRSRIGG